MIMQVSLAQKVYPKDNDIVVITSQDSSRQGSAPIATLHPFQ